MHKQGFTLIELLAVILIVGILTSIAVPQYRRSLDRSRVAESYQILTAIFDSRLRLQSERMLTQEPDTTFPLLDISLKGHVVEGSNGKQWETDYFTYHLDASTHGHGVWGQLKTGPHKNLEIFYNGSDFTCCDVPLNPGTIGDVCDTFNLRTDALCSQGSGGGGMDD